MTDPFRNLAGRLDDLALTGRKARFWLRDDDAVEPTEALDRLLTLTAAARIPVTLAVVPEPTGPALAQRLDAAPHARVAVHGWSHTNHARPGAKKCELGADRPLTEVLGELSDGLARLHHLHGPRLLPLLVPPWNRIARHVVDALPGLGFAALSIFGPPTSGPLPHLNTHVDLIDWHGTRGGRTAQALTDELVAAIDAGVPVIGLLTHHLVHDAAAWDFLRRFFALTADHPACDWCAAGDTPAFHTRP